MGVQKVFLQGIKTEEKLAIRKVSIAEEKYDSTSLERQKIL